MAVLHLFAQAHSGSARVVLDTGYHFAQTYEYRDKMAKEWALQLVNVLPKQRSPEQESAFGILYQSDPTRCCQLRKVDLFSAHWSHLNIWFTDCGASSPNAQEPERSRTAPSPHRQDLVEGKLLADWNWEQVWNYVNANDIGHLPQYDEGYLSIGCEPLYRAAAIHNPRSGRWGGTKLDVGFTRSQESRRMTSF